MGRYPVRFAVPAALAALLVVPVPGAAQCRLCATPTTSSSSSRPSEAPIRLDVVARLDFDKLILDRPGSGSATVQPDGNRRSSGAVGSVSMRAMAGEIVIRGEPDRFVRVDLPHALELVGANGGTLRLESIDSDLPSAPQLDSNGELRIRFGGEIHLSGDSDGDFRGDVPIVVDYL
ncbi:DUF4402 domain-containing protein [Sphingomonas sp. ASV193]|uniref:DUF4402 domain-containing protein n=1 Tax=Sphingomonas sp. ASV193 TaxID=3144405 RepID=UPI0032E8C06F